ncbi:MAG TPA: beta-ketoacyl synthase N-terminal-like domain-containing protein [Cellvibrionaceae bacterium]
MIKHKKVGASLPSMNSAIRYANAHCALGADLSTIQQCLTRPPASPATVNLDRLLEAVTQPYFALDTETLAALSDGLFASLQRLVLDALDHTGLDKQQRARTGLLVGSSSFNARASEVQYQRALDSDQADQATAFPDIGYGKVAHQIQQALGLSAHVYTYSTACTSSANALLYAHRLLQAGLIDHAVVLGFEYFNHTSLLGFAGLNLISPSASMRPFDPRRDGLVLGEGCGVLLLSRASEYPAVLQLCDGAIAIDNHSLTAANNDGSSLAGLIDKALATSGIDPCAVQAVKLHGTASMLNDEAEAAALQRVFGAHKPHLFALKPYTGHTLGACGALELALLTGCVDGDILPGNPGLTADAALGLSLAPTQVAAPDGYYLSNCFAFGGNNNVLVLQKTTL